MILQTFTSQLLRVDIQFVELGVELKRNAVIQISRSTRKIQAGNGIIVDREIIGIWILIRAKNHYSQMPRFLAFTNFQIN